MLSVVVGVATAAAMASTASAATIQVTSTSDSGPGSLRQAIASATGGDTIALPAGVYQLSSVLTVNKSLTFSGAGARTTIIDGQNATSLFSLQAPAAGVSMTGLTLRNGKSASYGGAILSSVPLTLTDDAIVGNTATSGSGGGISIAAQLTMEGDLVAGNSAPAGDGGGIELEPSSPSTSTISDTTIAQNEAYNTGGGVDESNSSTETLQLFNDTIDGNTLSGSGAQGGGFRAWSGTTIKFRNIVLAQNNAATEPTCAYGGGAFVTSLGHNVQDGNDPNCNFGAGDRVNVDPQLGPLANNGGPTDTLLPAVGSPLIDTGDTVNCTTTDQRGVPRPQGGGCDIGAVERTTPTAGTPLALGATTSGVTLSTQVNPVFIGGSFSYRYGPTTAYGTSTPAALLTSGVGTQTALAALAGLAPSTIYHAQLVLTTPDGTATSGDITFTTAAAAPPPQPPALSQATLTHKRFRVGKAPTAVSAKTNGRKRKAKAPEGTTFKFTLSAPAKVTVVIVHQVPGRRRGGQCVAPTRALKRKHAGRCQRTLVDGVLVRAHEPAGADQLAFSGRIGRRALRLGRYTAEITASNAAGASNAANLRFTVVA